MTYVWRLMNPSPLNRRSVVFVLALTLCHVRVQAQPRFSDVTALAGIRRLDVPTRKFGGASVADLDGDGFPDLLLGHHDSARSELYFNNGNGTFTKHRFGIFTDTHGINPFRASPTSRTLHFSYSLGGFNGNRLKPTLLFRVTNSRSIVNVTSTFGTSAIGRGRTAAFLSLRPGRRRQLVDAIFTNGRDPTGLRKRHHLALQSDAGMRFLKRKLTGSLLRQMSWWISVADVDADGVMEVLLFPDLLMYRITAPFVTKDITARVFPEGLNLRGVVGIAELDFDNDGRWDLYVARTNTEELSWLPSGEYQDYLLRNVGGRYVEVSGEMGIPRGLKTRGVTVGDFNNDGWIDILLSQYDRPDMLLLNRKGRFFSAKNAGYWRPKGIVGDMVTAVDYDNDGRLDVVVSQGYRKKRVLQSSYRIIRNVGGGWRNSILVRVGSSPNGTATSLHAVVTVLAGNGEGVLRMRRRVGSPGTSVSNSFIEMCHFGLRHWKAARKVVVRWTDGMEQVKLWTPSGATISMGVFLP